ncbi:MAG TPA: hypothetical protein VE135_23525 [Pyrinomonadaceae bacterium]|nr:hypothetical protein [Pyrinomonadaceae bacterium]
MDTLLKLLQYLPSVTELLAAWLVFLSGVGVGFLLAWPFKKRMDRELNQVFLAVQSELQQIATEIGKRRDSRTSINRRLSAQLPTTSYVNGPKRAVTDLLSVLLQLRAIHQDIASTVLTVETRPPENIELQKNTDHLLGRKSDVISNDLSTDTPMSSAIEDAGCSSTIVEGKGASFLEFYNQAVNDPLERERFRESYSPIRIGTVNAVERRQNPTIRPDIRETTDGNFFAFAIAGTNDFEVVPRLGLTIEAVGFTAGAIGEVFQKTRGYNANLFYSGYRVKQPAIFSLEGGRWQLREPGELDLGVGE